MIEYVKKFGIRISARDIKIKRAAFYSYNLNRFLSASSSVWEAPVENET